MRQHAAPVGSARNTKGRNNMKMDKYLIIALTAAGLFAGCSKPNTVEPVAESAPVIRSFNPLLPEKTAITTFYSEEQLNADDKIKALIGRFEAISGKSNKRFAEEAAEEDPEFKSSTIYKVLMMENEEAFKSVFGFPRSNVRWSLFTMIPTVFSDGETYVRSPDFAAVICCREGIDFGKTYPKARDFYIEYLTWVMSRVGASDDFDFAEITEQLGKFSTIAEGEYKGAKAVRLILDKEAAGVPKNLRIERFSPIATTLFDGQLIVLASSEEHLEEIEKMYNGEIPAAAEDSELAKETKLDGGTLFNISIIRPLDTLKAFCPDEMKAKIDYEYSNLDPKFAKYITGAGAFRMSASINTEKDSLSFSTGLSFTDKALAAELKETAEPMFNLIKGMVGMQQNENPAIKAILPIVNSAELKLKGNSLTFEISATAQDFETFMKFAEECSGLIGAAPCDDDDDEVFPGEDEIDDEE